MKVVYAQEYIPPCEGPSIFLAGPTPRSDKPVQSWRVEAFRLLEKHGFSGTVFVPEDRSGSFSGSYIGQVAWEKEALTMATIIMFWIPREIETMPAFTTNVEFGYWTAREPKKIVYGRPFDAPKTRYLDWLLSSEVGNYNISSSLEQTVLVAIKRVAEKIYLEESETSEE